MAQRTVAHYSIFNFGIVRESRIDAVIASKLLTGRIAHLGRADTAALALADAFERSANASDVWPEDLRERAEIDGRAVVADDGPHRDCPSDDHFYFVGIHVTYKETT